MTDSYDLVPYDCRAIPMTHPAFLATEALLRGREATAPDECRYLELGCGDGTNLLPIALAYPQSRFVGIDRCGGMLERGRATVAELGIDNLELREADLADVDGDVGKFDYIVSHGVFSWVDDSARARMMEVFRDSLSERGLGYLSYNTTPGWGLWGQLRKALRLRTRGTDDPIEKIRLAREHLGRLHGLRIGSERDPYGELVAQWLVNLSERSDSYLLHEYLAEHNRAYVVTEMRDMFAAHGLVEIADVMGSRATREGDDQLSIALMRAGLAADEAEVSADLLTLRSIRGPLICRDSGASTRLLGPNELVRRFEVAAALRPASPQTLFADDVEERFETPRGLTVGARPPLLKAALTVLGRSWPESLSFEDLLRRAGALLTATASGPLDLDADSADETLVDLMALRKLGHLELRAFPVGVKGGPSRIPEVSPLTRLEVARGRPVTNALHEAVELDPVCRELALLLDGTLDRGELEARLSEENRPHLGSALLVLAKNALLLA